MLCLINGQKTELPAGSVADLLRMRELTGKRVAIERNGQIVAKSQHGVTMLAEGDVVEIVVAVGGG